MVVRPHQNAPPIMNPLEAIEKWINEHASASVLQKHLSLVKDQLAACERRAETSETRALNAEATVKQLTISLEEARREIHKRDASPEPPPEISIDSGPPHQSMV